MKLIVGLGNPGRLYKDSRHNLGFIALKAFARQHKIALKKEKGIPALSGKGRVAGENLVLALPLTFMNLSGTAVKALLKKYKAGPQDLLVICDDLDLVLGSLKIRPQGSSAGHRGMGSVIEALKTEGFSRLRLGIGRPQDRRTDTSGYVLSSFSRQEKEKIKEVIEDTCACLRAWAKEGITKAMNTFNRRSR